MASNESRRHYFYFGATYLVAGLALIGLFLWRLSAVEFFASLFAGACLAVSWVLLYHWKTGRVLQ